MKRIMLISFSLLTVLFLVITAQAGPKENVNPDTYCTDTGLAENCNEDLFSTKFWKEKFIGGEPGQPGNVLMAIGEGFVFQNAVLKEVTCVVTAYPIVCTTTYTGGMLTLNSKGPWLNKGSLKAKNVIAINTSYHDSSFNLLGFDLTMSGPFEKSLYSYDIQASFDVTPDNYEIKIDPYDGFEFQRGFDFDAIITIKEDIVTPKSKK